RGPAPSDRSAPSAAGPFADLGDPGARTWRGSLVDGVARPALIAANLRRGLPKVCGGVTQRARAGAAGAGRPGRRQHRHPTDGEPMQSRRLLAAVTTATALTLALAACAGDATGTDPGSTPEPEPTESATES